MCDGPQPDLHSDLWTLPLPALQPGLSSSLGTARPTPSREDFASPATNPRQGRLAQGRLILSDHLKLHARFDNDLREYDVSLLRVREKVAVLHDLQRVFIHANGRVVSYVSCDQQFALLGY